MKDFILFLLSLIRNFVYNLFNLQPKEDLSVNYNSQDPILVNETSELLV
jgi:hypothetical protein